MLGSLITGAFARVVSAGFTQWMEERKHSREQATTLELARIDANVQVESLKHAEALAHLQAMEKHQADVMATERAFEEWSVNLQKEELNKALDNTKDARKNRWKAEGVLGNFQAVVGDLYGVAIITDFMVTAMALLVLFYYNKIENIDEVMAIFDAVREPTMMVFGFHYGGRAVELVKSRSKK